MSDAETIPADVMQAVRTLLTAATRKPTKTAATKRQGPPLLTIEEAARRLRVSRMTVDRAIKAGEFPVIKFRGTYRLPAAFIDRLLEDADAGAQVVVEDYAAAWIAEHQPADGTLAGADEVAAGVL